MSHLVVTSDTTEEKIQLNFDDAVNRELQSLSQICKHVTVMGKARTGKSFLLNAIAGQNGKFVVGNGGVVTKGVHISNETCQLGSESSIRMIDVEGMGEESDNYDYSLALPVLAASDLILFNFKGQPRSNDVIKELNLLLYIFKRVLENKTNKKAADEQKSKFLFPPIILVLRDWTFAESYTSEQYMGDILKSKDPAVQEILRCVKTIDVCFLPPPADPKTISGTTELPLKSMNKEFAQALNALKLQMVKYIGQPTATLLGSALSTTSVFLNTVKDICDQLNGSGFQIPDIMDAIGRNELNLAVDTIIDYIEEKYPTQLPMAKEELKKRMDTKLDAAIARFREVTQHLTSSRQKKMRDHEERNLKESILKDSKEKMRENDDVIEEELFKEAGKLLNQFCTHMSRIRDSTSDLLAVRREAEKQKGIFVQGLVDVARKNNFLGTSANEKIDEKIARKLLPIANHLKDFDLHAESEIKECEIRIERQNGAKSEAKLKNVQADAEKHRKAAEKAEEERKKLEKQLEEQKSRREDERRALALYAGGMSGGMGSGGAPWGNCWGSPMGYSGGMMGGGMSNFGDYQSGPNFSRSVGTSGRSYPGISTGSYSAMGHQLFQGPRGGIFHVSSQGNRVYHPRY